MITEDRDIIERIIRKATVCRVAASVGDQPYIIALNFGYENGTLFFHGLRRNGKFLGMIQENARVCFALDADQELVISEQACKWDMKYRSVVGFGTASIVQGTESKKNALTTIMRQYADRPFTFPDKMVDKTTLIQVKISGMTGKENGYE